MSEQGQTTAQMDAALAGMVDQIATRRPTMPTVVARGPDVPVTSIGAMAVAKRLEELTKQADALAKQAELLATALAGPVVAGPPKTAQQRRTVEHQGGAPHLFGKQMLGLDEVGQQLDAIHAAIERAARSLT